MKKRRVALNLKQAEAAQKAGITLGTLQKFEQTGRVSLERFLRLCHTYRMEGQVIAAIENQSAWTLEQIKRADTKKTVRLTAAASRNKLTPAQVKRARHKEETARSKKAARPKKAARFKKAAR